MTTMRVPRLHAGDDATGRGGPLQRFAHRLHDLFARLGRGASVTPSPARASSEAPWVAEMLSAFGDAVMPFDDVHPDDVDRARALRNAPVERRKLHLA